MQKDDFLARIECQDYNIRIFAAQTLKLASKISGIHNTAPNATVAIGRLLNAAILLAGSSLKYQSRQSISVKISGTGHIKELTAQVDGMGNVRGYVANPLADIDARAERIDIPGIIGNGFLTVDKDLGLKEPYKTVIPLYHSDIAMDVTQYLAESEQIPSALMIALNLGKEGEIISSGGILIQTFPGTPDSVITEIEERMTGSSFSLDETLRQGKDIYAGVSEILGNRPMEILSETPLSANCRCSREMLKNALHTIDRNEIQKMIEEDGGAEMHCSFCNTRYEFTEAELRSIIQQNNIH